MRVRPLLLVSMLVVVAFVLILSGCATPKENAVSPTPAPPTAPAKTGMAPAGEPIKVGCIFSESGPGAPLGQPEQLAAEMVEKQVNDAGGISGRPLKLIIEDDATEEGKAVLAAKKLMEQDKVCAIVGPTMSGTTLAIADTCDKAGMPLFSCAASVKITQPVKKFVFSSAQTDVLAVQRILPYLKDHKLTKIAIIYDSNAFGQSGAEQLKKLLPGAGAQIVDEEKFATKDTDMTAQITKIKAKNPQAVICWGTNPGPAVVAKNMQSLGLKAALIMSHGVANKTFIDQAGAAAEGVVLPCGRLLVASELADKDPQKAVLLQFKKDYEAANPGKPVNTFAGHAYDALEMLIAVLKTAGEDKAKIRDGLEATKAYVGIGGTFNMSATDHNGLTPDAFTLAVIKGGTWTQTK
jgi:branched-chain amino acid transport system substrate-binding protein